MRVPDAVGRHAQRAFEESGPPVEKDDCEKGRGLTGEVIIAREGHEHVGGDRKADRDDGNGVSRRGEPAEKGGGGMLA